MMIIRAILIPSAFLAVSHGSSLSAAATPPNIVVILTGDQGYADISLNPHNSKEVSTPHMDGLAHEGVAFSQAYTVVRRGQKLGTAIRADHWRYARWPDGEELYDLKNDAEENLNLARSGEHTQVLSVMRARLSRAERSAAARR